MSSVSLDWSSAEVQDGRLEVPLRGELPSGWKQSFERTVALLPGGDWGEIKLKKDRVRVHDVTEGDEDRLHHFLESVVQQANAGQEDEDEDERDGDHEDEDTDEDEDAGPDHEMTERFRSFAAEPQD